MSGKCHINCSPGDSGPNLKLPSLRLHSLKAKSLSVSCSELHLSHRKIRLSLSAGKAAPRKAYNMHVFLSGFECIMSLLMLNNTKAIRCNQIRMLMISRSLQISFYVLNLLNISILSTVNMSRDANHLINTANTKRFSTLSNRLDFF